MQSLASEADYLPGRTYSALLQNIDSDYHGRNPREVHEDQVPILQKRLGHDPTALDDKLLRTYGITPEQISQPQANSDHSSQNHTLRIFKDWARRRNQE